MQPYALIGGGLKMRVLAGMDLHFKEIISGVNCVTIAVKVKIKKPIRYVEDLFSGGT